MRIITTHIQIRFSDVDKLGHVNNAFYLSYIELARMKYFEEIAGGINWENEGVIVARAEMDYRAPVLLADKIYVNTWCSRIGNKSFDLSYTLFKSGKSGDTEALHAKTVMVCFNYQTQKSFPVPAKWREWLQK